MHRRGEGARGVQLGGPNQLSFYTAKKTSLEIFTDLSDQGGGGTVGQDVDELICQSERKMQQNATFYL